MTDAGKARTASDSANFHEAIAQWRLNLRTEVKRSSSLPTAMFDACDPMLETRLAESAEAMLACLQEPEAHVAGEPLPVAERRIENVGTDEVLALIQRLGPATEPPDLEAILQNEYFSILADACCSADTRVRQSAARLLRRDFALSAPTHLPQLASMLATQLEAATDGGAHGAPAEDNRIDTTCQAIVAALAADHDAEGPA